MTSRSSDLRFPPGALSWLLCLTLAASPVRAQDPWTKVPPLPTSCYQKDDKFAAGVAAAIAALEASVVQQRKVNDDLRTQMQNLDPQTRSSRMMAFMQRDPANSMKYMQEVQQLTAKQKSGETDPRREEFNERYKTIQHDYEADVSTQLGPARVVILTTGGEMVSDADWKKAQGAVAKVNATYPKLCEKWIIRGGFGEYLSDYKRYLIDVVVAQADSEDHLAKLQFEMMGIPSTSYRSTAAADAVLDYMKVAERIFLKRPNEPLKGP